MKLATVNGPSGSRPAFGETSVAIVSAAAGIAILVGCESGPGPGEDQGATHSALSDPWRGPGPPVPRPLPEAGAPKDEDAGSAPDPADPGDACFDQCVATDDVCAEVLDECEFSCDGSTDDGCVVTCVTQRSSDCADFFDGCDAQCAGGGDPGADDAPAEPDVSSG